MQAFKIQYFEQDNPEQKFPHIRLCSDDEGADFRRHLDFAYRRVFSAESLPELNANTDEFQLADVWQSAGITPEDDILITFDAFKCVESMRRNDLESIFGDIWYPVSDDLLLFDRSKTWLVYVHHDGYVYAIQ